MSFFLFFTFLWYWSNFFIFYLFKLLVHLLGGSKCFFHPPDNSLSSAKRYTFGRKISSNKNEKKNYNIFGDFFSMKLHQLTSHVQPSASFAHSPPGINLIMMILWWYQELMGLWWYHDVMMSWLYELRGLWSTVKKPLHYITV